MSDTGPDSVPRPEVPGRETADHEHPALEGVRVAVVNWRDPWQQAAGGAESYAWHVSLGLLARGARVHYVTSRQGELGQQSRERRAGIELHRMGGRFTLYPRVLGWLARRRHAFDIVVDCQNGIPFFTPTVLPRRVAVICVVHHVHDRQFALHFPRWLARIGRWLEGPVARRVYRHRMVAAVSQSTVTALRERLGWTGPVTIVPNGTTVTRPSAETAPTTAPTLVCVGRLVAHKRVERVVDMAGELARRWPRAHVHIVGRGPAEADLRARIRARGLAGRVTLHGYLSDEDKVALLAGAWLHLSTSSGEGWGLSVMEAAALGVPTVAYDVDGLRDAVRHGETGWLVPEGATLTDTVDRALGELAGPARREQVRRACRDWAQRFTWERTTALMSELVRAELAAAGGAGARGGHGAACAGEATWPPA